MKKIIYFLIAIVILGLAGFGIYKAVSSSSSSKEKPGETITYTVKFNSNGGNLINEQKVKKGEKAEKPADPVNGKYPFANWYLEDNVYDFSNPVTEDITLDARWITTLTDWYTVTFKYNNGNKDGIIRVEKNDVVIKPTNVTRKGYTFLGWYLNGVSYNFSNKITKNIILEARWKKIEEVKPPAVNVNATGVTLNKTTLNLSRGNSETLTATVSPTNTTNKTLTWTSSNTKVATVTNGKVVAVGIGSATITVSTINKKLATCTVNVDAPLTGLIVNKTSGALALYPGGPSVVLEARKLPSDTTTAGNVEWFSYDALGQNGSITITPNGNRVTVTPRSSGASNSATITAKLGTFSKSYTIPIENKLTVYNATGDVNASEISYGRVGATKYPATITFNFNVKISSSTEKSNIDSVSGYGTQSITVVAKAGSISSPALITFVSQGGQTLKMLISRDY